MKLKGISPLEQHVEQIVLVTVSGIFLVVVAAQFLITTNKVTVDGQELAPGKAFEPAAQRAVVLKEQIGRTDVELPEIPAVTVADMFRDRLQGPVTPTATLAAPLGQPMKLEGVITTDSQMGAREIAMAPIPAPQQPAAYAYRFTIDPTEPASIPGLKALLPAEQPLDEAAVSVEAVMDGSTIRAALQGGGEKAIPGVWWGNDRTAVLGVRLEREEMVEPGTWSNLTDIAPPPGRTDGVTLAQQMQSGAATGSMNDLVAELAYGGQEDVLRPAFYRTIAGMEWLPPTEAMAKTPVDERNVSNLVSRLNRTREQIQRLETALQEAGAPSQPRQPRQPSGGGGGGGKSAGGGGGGGGVQAPSPSPSPTSSNQRVNSIQRSIEAKQREEQQLLEELGALGRDENGNRVVKEPPAPEQGQTQDRVRVLDDSSVRLWSHDLTAEPGKTYRYRVRFAINNPAFGRGAALVPEQQELAASPVVWSEPSGWTAPVAVPADHYYFVTSASESNSLGEARVQADVYRFFYGYYRKGSVGMEPGDILTAQVKLPDPSKLPIYDISQITSGTPDMQQPMPEAAPGGKGGPTSIAPPPSGLAPQGEQAAATLPTGATPWDQPIVASEDVVLLDVARVPTEEKVVAILRGRDGSLIRIVPDQDASGMRQLVEESARAGENQGQPVIRPVEPDRPAVPNRPLREREDDRGPSPAPGGGGGAGGG